MKNTNLFLFLKRHAILISILVISLLLRIYRLDFQSLWMDEIYTMNVSNPSSSFATIYNEVNNREGFPYFYFFFLKLLFSVFGYTSVIARMLSVVAGIASIILLYKITEKIVSKNAGLIVAALVCFNQYHIYISQDARPYTLYLTATLLVYYRMWAYLENKSLKNAVFYGLAAGLLLNTNFFGFINLFCQAVFISYHLLQTKTTLSKVLLSQFALIGGIALILFLPNYQKFILLFGKGEFWVPKPTSESFTLMLKEIYGNSEFLLFIYTAIFYFLLAVIFSKKGNIRSSKSIYSTVFLLFWMFPFLMFLLVKSYGGISLILTRYFTSLYPVIFIFIAWGIAEIKSKTLQITTLSIISMFSLITLFYEKNYYGVPSKAQFREASNTVLNNNTKKHNIYTSQKYWFDYYFNNKGMKLEELEFENLIQQMSQNPANIKSFWFVDAFGKTYQPSENALAFISKNFVIEKSFDGFQGWAKHFVLPAEMQQSVNLTGLNINTSNSGDGFMNNIEIFEIKENKLTISGWAYFNDIDSQNSVVNIVLISPTTNMANAKTIFIESVNRPDVSSYFKTNFNANNSGFKANFDLQNLDDQEYKIAIYLENKKYNKKGLYLSDKKVKKL